MDSTKASIDLDEPTELRSGPSRPPLPLTIWHVPQAAAPKKSSFPCAASPVSAAETFFSTLRMYVTTCQISSSDMPTPIPPASPPSRLPHRDSSPAQRPTARRCSRRTIRNPLARDSLETNSYLFGESAGLAHREACFSLLNAHQLELRPLYHPRQVSKSLLP